MVGKSIRIYWPPGLSMVVAFNSAWQSFVFIELFELLLFEVASFSKASFFFLSSASGKYYLLSKINIKQ